MNIYAQRLLNVAKACRETRFPDQFTMRTCAHGCGTPACAVGNYAFRGDLQNEFSLRNDGLLLSITGQKFENGTGCPLCQHFGITVAERDNLFEKRGCNDAQTPNAAADYIEAFVAKKWPETVRPVRDEAAAADFLTALNKLIRDGANHPASRVTG